MIKLYIQNKPLFLVDKIEGEVNDYLHRPTTIFLDELNPSAIDTLLHELKQPEYYAGILLHNEVDKALEEFKSQFHLIVAAGGLVETEGKEFLMIFRKGKWDLPKGKLDEGEDLETCALREIEEETGAKGLRIERPFYITYHTYYQGESHILKESHWFLVSSPNKMVLNPQTEEDIEKCEWVLANKLAPYIGNMHASIVDVVQKRLHELGQNVF